METLNDRIKELRKNKGLTQLQLAELLNVTDKAVSKWEVGEANPDISLLPKISEIFGVTLDYLLTGKKEEEKISLDDMDVNKRMEYLIKKDDAENFVKYGYTKHEWNSNTSSIYRGGSYHTNSNKTLPWIDLNTWDRIIDAGASKIFNASCDSLIGYYGEFCLSETGNSITAIFGDKLDKVVKMAIDLDRVDVLKLFWLKYLKIGVNPAKGRFEPSQNRNEEVGCIAKDTLEYFFQMKDKSPKSFEYITCYEPVVAYKTSNHWGHRRNGEMVYMATFIEDCLFELCVKYNCLNEFRTILNVAKAETEKVNVATANGWFYRYRDTFVTTSGGESVLGRIVPIKESTIKELIKGNNIELAKECLAYNALAIAKIQKVVGDYDKSKLHGVFQMSDIEIDRYFNLNRTDISADDKLLLECVNNHIIVKNRLLACRDLKFVRKVIDRNYVHPMEFVYDALMNHKEKELFKFFIDSQDESLAEKLMESVALDDNYQQFLESAWFKLSKVKDAHDIGLDSNGSICKQVLGDDHPYSDNSRTARDLANACIVDLNDNKIYRYIVAQKESIYSSVSATIAAEKQAKADADERAKIVKELPYSYFEGLLSKNETEIFVIKLCALFDALLKFDHKMEGADFHERMKNYFDNGPKSRDCDDGWGYMVLDTEYEESTVKPWNAKRELLNRLRIQRNNIAHSETNPVKELTKAELAECLQFVFKANKDYVKNDDYEEDDD